MAKILIVDDHAPNRELIATLVGYEGHQPLEAGDGAEALDVVRAERPQLVICDIVMPSMDGYEFVRRLRAEPAIADTPVMFYTANYHEREASRLAAQLGVSRILTKPCDPDEILAAVGDALAQPRSPAPPPPAPSPSFDHEHLRLLTDKLAAKVDELERANQQLAALTELNLALSAERDTHALLDRVCQGARELTGARYAVLCIAAPNGDGRAGFRFYGLSADENLRFADCRIEGGPFGRVMAERRALRFHNPGGRPEGIGLPMGFPAVHCGVAAPIASALSVFGWVGLLDKVGANEFTREDEWISGAHAAQAGRIYENSHLYAQLERRAEDLSAEIGRRRLAERQLRRVARARRVMAEANRALVRAPDETQLLAAVCRILVDIGDYPLAWIELVRGDGALATAASAGDRGLLPSVTGGEAAAGPVLAALGTGRPQLIPELAANRAADGWSTGLLARGFTATAALPLTADGRTLGVLGLVAAEEPAFDHDEAELLGQLADDIGYGLQTLGARAAQQRMEKTLRLHDRAIEQSLNAIVISEADPARDNPVIYANPAFTQMTGYAVEEVLGRNPRFLLGDDLDQPELERLRDAVRRGLDTRVTLRNYRKDGTMFWNDLSLAWVPDPHGQMSHFIAVFNDLTERKHYERELEQQASHDALTGVANRTLLYDRMHNAIAHARRGNGAMAVMLLDLDHFKQINDTFGHADGDTLLREVARRLVDGVRQSDTVGRLGGDEFMVVMSEMTSEGDAATLAAKLLAALARPVALSTREVVVSASLGVALYPRDGDSATKLVKNADVALYRAKELGRNGYQFYAEEMNARVLERLQLEDELRRALSRDELVLHYQPKAELRRGRVVGAEALIRWRHPVLGLLPPGEFIPLAEETGLIGPIGEWVFETVCRQLAAWRADGLPDIDVAVNVSAGQLHGGELPSVLARATAAAGVAPQRLHVEVTESVVMRSPEQAVGRLREIKRTGARVSLDDFGTGYSNLNHLKRLPFDSFKIDESFMGELTTSADEASIASMVISIAHNLGCTVIAEGVETDAQLAFLRRHDCDEMQGCLFCGPIPAADFARLLRDGVRLKLA